MKPHHLSDAIGRVPDRLLREAEELRSGSVARRRRTLRIACAAAACIIVAVACIPALQPGPASAPAAYAIAEAVYPEIVPRPNYNAYMDPETGAFDGEGWRSASAAWQDSIQAMRDQPAGYTDGMEDFCGASIRAVLSGAGDANRAYSPLNLYMALSMLAEITGGDSQSQILTVLGASDTPSLREKAASLWEAHYCDDGSVTSTLANSVWLNRNITYREEPLRVLAEKYRASSYTGAMGSDEYNALLQEWLNANTGGLLQDAAGNAEFSPDCLMALASTVFFRARWQEEFYEGATRERVFRAPSGDILCDFMHSERDLPYHRGENFAAAALSMENSGRMWLILPDEGVSVDRVLESDLSALYLAQEEETRYYSATVDLAVPRFDIVSEIDLRQSMERMGITQVLDPYEADFSPVMDAPAFLSQATHAARVAIDEEGVVATAFTLLEEDAAADLEPHAPIPFVLDRPFLFIITGHDGVPLFTGVVNTPVI